MVASHMLTASGTTEVSVYYFWHQGVRIWLVDTPGFDDTERSDSDILRDVAFWLASVYIKEARLAGIIYLHRISDVRLGGQALKNLRMFKQLCGQSNLNSVILATTHWSSSDGVRISERVGRERETELIDTEGFWGGMIEKGSEVMRHDGSTESAMDIVLKIVKRKLRVVLDIQTQLVDEKRSLDDTDISRAQSSIQEIQRKHEETKTAHLESLSSLRVENANQMREMERQLRESSDEATRQQLRDQQAAYDKIYERQVGEQNRLWEKERDALNRQEALRAREQAEYQLKLDALELKSRKSKTFFSDAVQGICTALSLGLEIARVVRFG
jgi:hypothetical protein